MMTSEPTLRSGVISTLTSVSGSGWHSGISSAVRLAAMMPATSATLSTSPLVLSPSMTSVSVSWSIFTVASAVARRAVGGLSVTSTMRGRPNRSTWLKARRSLRVTGSACLGWPGQESRDFCVKPDDLHVGSGRGFGSPLRDDGEPVGRGERGEDV